MDKEPEKIRETACTKRDINEELEIVFKKQILELKVCETKNSLEVLQRRLEQAEERVNEPEDRMIEIITCEERKIQRMKKSEWSLRNLWHDTKRVHILMMRIPVEKRRGGNLKK